MKISGFTEDQIKQRLLDRRLRIGMTTRIAAYKLIQHLQEQIEKILEERENHERNVDEK